MIESRPKDSFSYMAFIYLGVCSLLSFNVILTSMSLYEQNYSKDVPDYKPSFLFPNMNIVLNMLFQLYLVVFGNRFRYLVQMLFALVLFVIIMIILPFIGMYVEGVAGYVICCLLVALQGFANSIYINNIYGISGYLPFKFMIAVSYGDGLAGLIVGILQYILLFSYGIDNADDREVVISSSYWFYFISVGILIGGIVVLIINFNNPWFINELANGGSTEFSAEQVADIKIKYFSQKNEKITEPELELKHNPDEIVNKEAKDFENQECTEVAKVNINCLDIPNSKLLGDFRSVMSKLFSLNVYIFVIYVTTFSIYPGVLFVLKL